VTATSRRGFLQAASSSGAAFVIAVHLPEAAFGAEAAAGFQPNAYLRIDPDDSVTLWITRAEMGQGVRTTLAMVLADELEVEWDRVHLAQAEPDARFEGIRLRTSGSGSAAGTFGPLRQAAATAREMLIAAAAQRWEVAPASCQARSGAVGHPPSGRRLSYGALAADASRQPVPASPRVKAASELRLVGRPQRRVDGPEIVAGRAVYGLDVRRPGMLFAVIARSPRLGGRPGRVDTSRALAIDGVRNVVPVRSGLAQGMAVVADDTWAALCGRDALSIDWETGPASDFDSEQFIGRLHAALDEKAYVVRRDGDAAAAFASAARRLDATYVYPFQAHAPLETMNCTADVRDGRCEVWAPTQTPDRCQEHAARVSGLPPAQVTIHVTLMGGGFGRRLFADYVAEAVEISKQVARPVQVVWTREDDMRHGFFQPASVDRLRAALDGDGRLRAWFHAAATSDHSMPAYHTGTPAEAAAPDAYAMAGSPWGAYDNPYRIPAMAVDYVPVESPVPVGPWRAVQYPPTVFARESFVDEVAAALGKDPLAFRLELLEPGDVLTLGMQKLDRGRLARVLRLAAEKSQWDRPLRSATDRLVGRGVALNVYHTNSYLAQVAEVSVARDLGGVRVERIVCVSDCGLVINPLGLEGQVESGIAWGLSAALYGPIDFRRGAAVQGSYTDFRVVGMSETPAIESHVVIGADRPGGFGEHPVPTVAPAVANAVAQATGRRVRRLPITPAALRSIPAALPR
jgi:isoquinoline 1-oxidoreductase beta subunit